MLITLENVSKRFGSEYIIKDANLQLRSGKMYVVAGPNGSGKSTLMKLLSGFLSPSSGRITFSTASQELIPPDMVYQHIAYTAPYIELIEEFTMQELLAFHARARGWRTGFTSTQVAELSELTHVLDRPLKHFSSGMKQRLKIAVTLCTQADIILLDEPTTNLDLKAIGWYQNTTRALLDHRLLVIASNDPTDLELTSDHIQLGDLKGQAPR